MDNSRPCRAADLRYIGVWSAELILGISYLTLSTILRLQQDGKLAAAIHFQRAMGHLDHLDLQFLIGFEFANEHH